MRKLRDRNSYVGSPTLCVGASQTSFGESVSIRDIVTRFTSQVMKEDFSNRDFFHDFDINAFMRGDEVDTDRLFAACDSFIPIRSVDIDVASTEARLNYYRQYISDAKAYFAEKDREKAAKLAEQERLAKSGRTSAANDQRSDFQSSPDLDE